MQIYMQEKYGPISSIYVGTRPLIFLSDLGLIKELYKQLEASGRPNNKPFHEIRFGSEDGTQRGLLASTGKEWQEQRRFTMRQLRDLGFGKSSMEDAINDEVEKLVKLLEEVDSIVMFSGTYLSYMFLFRTTARKSPSISK